MAHMIIGGKAVQAQSGKTLEVRSPVDGLSFEAIPRGEAADIDLLPQRFPAIVRDQGGDDGFQGQPVQRVVLLGSGLIAHACAARVAKG